MDKTEIIAIFDLRNAPHGLYDVEVINPNGETAIAPYRYLVEQALEPDVSIALGGPRVVWAGAERAVRLHAHQPHQRRHPVRLLPVRRAGHCRLNEGVPYLGLHHQPARERPNVADVPWASLVAQCEHQRRRSWRPATPSISPTARTRRFSFIVQTYPDGLPPGAYSEQPGRHRLRLPHHGRGDAADPRRVHRPADASSPPRCGPTFCKTRPPRRPCRHLAADADLLDRPLPDRADPGGPAAARGCSRRRSTTTRCSSACRPRWPPASSPARPASRSSPTATCVDFFDQVRKWYGDDADQDHALHRAPGSTRSAPTTRRRYFSFDPPPASDFNLEPSARTHFEGFNVYVPWANDWDFPEASGPRRLGRDASREPQLRQRARRRTSLRSSARPGDPGRRR